jgi:hypothetical protein
MLSNRGTNGPSEPFEAAGVAGSDLDFAGALRVRGLAAPLLPARLPFARAVRVGFSVSPATLYSPHLGSIFQEAPCGAPRLAGIGVNQHDFAN